MTQSVLKNSGDSREILEQMVKTLNGNCFPYSLIVIINCVFFSVLLFVRERNINWSADMQAVYINGTFSITPEPFAQVHVILAERSARVDNRGKWVFPVLFALLKNKSRTTYLKLFE
uniref:Uncharacterized protein n=1 Tax=Ditylenchus dipsaci TaxID=166011 RepID=A0A915CXB4_9BILA